MELGAMRLIDADEFRERIDHYPQDIRDIAKKELRYCKTIEAEPVKHGKWIYKEYKMANGESIGYFVCSECGHATWNEKDNHYCLNCGCKMDEVEE